MRWRAAASLLPDGGHQAADGGGLAGAARCCRCRWAQPPHPRGVSAAPVRRQFRLRWPSADRRGRAACGCSVRSVVVDQFLFDDALHFDAAEPQRSPSAPTVAASRIDAVGQAAHHQPMFTRGYFHVSGRVTMALSRYTVTLSIGSVTAMSALHAARAESARRQADHRSGVRRMLGLPVLHNSGPVDAAGNKPAAIRICEGYSPAERT